MIVMIMILPIWSMACSESRSFALDRRGIQFVDGRHGLQFTVDRHAVVSVGVAVFMFLAVLVFVVTVHVCLIVLFFAV
ncbi:hypothetical protein M758_UG190500 [Ceratodon purpureus]|nr:hypothetical protein M758_UG190500 [Ceratodon purpureus]